MYAPVESWMSGEMANLMPPISMSNFARFEASDCPLIRDDRPAGRPSVMSGPTDGMKDMSLSEEEVGSHRAGRVGRPGLVGVEAGRDAGGRDVERLEPLGVSRVAVRRAED